MTALGQMQSAFRGYLCDMKQAAKAIALILFVSLLSGCSSSSEPADKPQAKNRCEIAVEKLAEKAGLLKELQNAKKIERNIQTLSLLYYIVEESDCFDSEIVSTAKAGIALILKQ